MWLTLALATPTACRCNPSTSTADAQVARSPRPSDEPEFFESFDGGNEDSGPSLPRCSIDAMRALPGGDSGAARYEMIQWVARGRAAYAAFVDRASARLVFAPFESVARVAPIVADPAAALAAVPLNDERWMLFSVGQRGRARWFEAFVADRSALRSVASQTGPDSDDLGLAACAVRGGALVAWDEATSLGRSVVRVQRWTGDERSSPSSVIASEAEHDASDPVLHSLPDGGALLAYLSLQEVEVETANQSAAEIVLRSLGPDGRPRGSAVIITPRPKTRFGVTLHVAGDARWVAWRLAADSDHQGLGDGGRVAVVAIGEDLRPLRTPEYLTDLDVVPSGRTAIVSEHGRADVYWVERRGEELVTVRRPVARDGRVLGPARDEPALSGQIPFGGSSSAPLVPLWGRQGEPAVVIARCPP